MWNHLSRFRLSLQTQQVYTSTYTREIFPGIYFKIGAVYCNVSPAKLMSRNVNDTVPIVVYVLVLCVFVR